MLTRRPIQNPITWFCRLRDSLARGDRQAEAKAISELARLGYWIEVDPANRVGASPGQGHADERPEPLPTGCCEVVAVLPFALQRILARAKGASGFQDRELICTIATANEKSPRRCDDRRGPNIPLCKVSSPTQKEIR